MKKNEVAQRQCLRTVLAPEVLVFCAVSQIRDSSRENKWSGREDLNFRPLLPKPRGFSPKRSGKRWSVKVPPIANCAVKAYLEMGAGKGFEQSMPACGWRMIPAMPRMNQMLRTAIIFILSLVCFAGCSTTTKSLTWKSSNIAIGDFKSFAIQPVANATGGVISQEVLASLTLLLGDRFKANNLQLADSQSAGSDSLTVQSEVLEYKFQYFTGPPPPSGNTAGLCIVRTHLLQMPENILVAEIVTINTMDVGQGMLEPKRSESLLKECAATIAKEVDRLI